MVNLKYELNKYGKIITTHSNNAQDVYYGYVAEADSQTGVLKLYVVDWRDRFKKLRQFYKVLAPMQKTVIKYNTDIEVEQ